MDFLVTCSICWVCSVANKNQQQFKSLIIKRKSPNFFENFFFLLNETKIFDSIITRHAKNIYKNVKLIF